MNKKNDSAYPLNNESSSQEQQRQATKALRRKQLAKAKQQEQRPKRKPPRRKSWRVDQIEDEDEMEASRFERVMPRGERERRRAVERKAFSSGVSAAAAAPDAAEMSGTRGRVSALGNNLCYVQLDGHTLLCHIRGSLNAEEQGFTTPVAVGDEVLISEDGAGGGVVEAVLPRRSILARPDVFHGHLRQIIVANADQLLIVASWRDPAIWLELIDRYLVTAARSNLQPILCINKIDLVSDEAAFQETLEPYRSLGLSLVPASAEQGLGIEELRQMLAGRTTVLAGLSGVGKSSIIAAIQPGLQLRTGAVSSSSKHLGEGQHTTTQATLLQLEDGAVIDTPGIREFGLSGLRRSELGAHFPEIAALAQSCRYRDCAHLQEPHCAVQQALERDLIAASRYHSYRRIYASLPA